ncbi:MAG: glycosyltransferase family 2 protein, partial [Nitrososphaerales archaeon]
MTELIQENKIQLEQVTVVIFTKSVSSKNYQKCISCLPEGVKIFTIQGAMIFHDKTTLVHPRLYAKKFNFARNCNISAEMIQTEWMLLLNDDCFLHKGCLEEMLEVEIETKADIIGASLFNSQGLLQSRGFKFSPNKIAASYFEDNSISENRYDETEGATAACLLVRTRVIRKIHWDEKYPLSCEDVDFCIRAKQGGYKIVVANNAIATHLVGSSSQGTQRKKISSTLYLWNKFPHLRPQNRGLAL